MVKRRHAVDDKIVADVIDAALAEVIANNTPDHCGNRAAFTFCRHFMKVHHEDNANALEDFAHEFFERAMEADVDRFVIQDEYGDPLDFDEFWLQVRQTWGKPRFAAGLSFKKALELARKMKPRPEATKFEEKGMQVLVGVCWLLQTWAGDEPFFLSGVDAAKCFGKNAGGQKEHKFGFRKLKVLRDARIIELVKIGHTGRASDYVYLSKEKE